MSFLTIREVAATGLVSEHYIRTLVRNGKCPGIRSGNRFLVNVEQLREKLEADSNTCGNEVKSNE